LFLNSNSLSRAKPLNGASTSTQTNPDGTSVETTTSILANGNTQTTSSSYSSLPSQSLLSSVSYAYDPATLSLATETVTIDPDGNGPLPSLTRILDRSTDTLGRQRSTGILPVSNGSAEHSLTYDYDDSGRLSTITSPAGTFTYAYTPNSSLIASVTTSPLPLGEGQGEGAKLTATNTWEPNRDVLDVKDNRIPSTTLPISRFDYTVNGINQRTQVETTGTAFPSQPADWTWGYDALGQVTSADSPTNTYDRAYEYDAIANRKRSADGALVTTGSSATVYDANPLNQYSGIQIQQSSIVNPVHDPDGNATSYPLPVAPNTNATLAYDGENRLVSITTGTTTVTYAYDSQSRRVARTESPLPLGEGQGEGAQHTLYLYDGWNCLAEYVLHTSSFNLHTSFSWGLDLSGSLQGAGGVGGLLSVTKHQAQSTTHYFPTFDGNGNVSEYLDATGSTAAHYEYDPFGRTIFASGSQAADFSYRFSTKPVDAATGLYYYGYRWYDQETGRWLNRDPIEERGGVNLYGFVTNQTTFAHDFLGLAEPGEKRDCYWKLLVGHGLIPTLKLKDAPLEDPALRTTYRAIRVMAAIVQKPPTLLCGDRIGFHGCYRASNNGALIKAVGDAHIIPSVERNDDRALYSHGDGTRAVTRAGREDFAESFRAQILAAVADAKAECNNEKSCCKTIKMHIDNPDPEIQA
jgi:RHS repeat-associated protein